MHTRLNNMGGWAYAAQCGVVLLCVSLLCGCRGELSWGLDSFEDVARPGATGGPEEVSGQAVAVIRRAQVPRDLPTGKAWELVNQRVVLPLQHGAWQGNGLRIGVMPRGALDAYGDRMPTPLASSQAVMSQSKHAVPIIETPVLSPNLQFEIDLTRPPGPAVFEPVVGGKNSRLRLLARIEPAEEGGYALVLTPQHYVPSPYDLIPRDPHVKEMDGRVFEALSLRLPLGPEQIAVVGLHWPWPEALVRDAEQALAAARSGEAGAGAIEPGQAEPRETAGTDPRDEGRRSESEEDARARPLPPAETSDPAAPPPHLRGLEPIDRQADRDPADSSDDRQEQREIVTPPLPLHFGSTLLTAPGIGGVPTQTVLLITIERR